MHEIQILLVLLVGVVLLAVLAGRVVLPYPMLLVGVGLTVGLVPGLPRITLAPDLVFLLFLPPILYAAAWYTSFNEFKRNIEPIAVLAVGLVLATTVGVAWAARTFIPGLSWAEGFLLGAIISPPDAVAATAVLQGLNVSKRLVTIIEGESLVNDSTGLVAFGFALEAVLTGRFSLAEAGGQFVVVSLGGIGIGWGLGWLLVRLHKHLLMAPAVETALTLVTPFAAYLLAEQMHVSGVLAVVVTGLLVGKNGPRIHSSRMRLQAVAVWEVFILIINGLVFILIGLQLPYVLERVGATSKLELLGYGALVSATTVFIRIGYVHVADLLSRNIRRRAGRKPVFDNWKETTLLAWTGMRGVVSLAAALSLPLVLTSGAPFYGRDLIIFITFSVILVTLLLQGVSLPYLIKALKMPPVPPVEAVARAARLRTAQAGLVRLDELIAQGKLSGIPAKQTRERHEEKINALQNLPPDSSSTGALPAQVRLAVLTAERQQAIHMRDRGEIDDELLHALEHELDLEEARLRKYP